MAVSTDDVKRLKERLAKDLEVVRQFEELLARHGLNGNGNSHEVRDTGPTLPGIIPDPPIPVRPGSNTGLGDKILELISVGAATTLSTLTDLLIKSGYPHSSRDNLKIGVSGSLKRLVRSGRLHRNNGVYSVVKKP